MLVPFLSECRESKVRYSAPWGGKGGFASAFQGLPWGIDTFHFPPKKSLYRPGVELGIKLAPTHLV